MFNFERSSATDGEKFAAISKQTIVRLRDEQSHSYFNYYCFFLLFEKDKSDDTIILNSFRFVKYHFFLSNEFLRISHRRNFLIGTIVQ